MLRARVSGISTMGRATQGVRVMDLDRGEKIVSMARLAERDVAVPEGERRRGRVAARSRQRVKSDGANRSSAVRARSRRVIPGGVNSPVRAFGSVGGTPRFIARGRGARDLGRRRQRATSTTSARGAR